MRVVVIGAGIAGVCTAYELAADGHDVVVVEGLPAVAAAASFAPGALLGPGCAAPWFDTPTGWPALLAWARKSKSPSDTQRAAVRLAREGRDRWLTLFRTLRLEGEQSPSVLVPLRTERDATRAQAALALLGSEGVAFERADPARCREVEPGLHPDTPMIGGIVLPGDGVANCRQLAHLLKAEAQRLGASFRFDQPVTALRAGTPVGVEVGGAWQSADAIVLCAGAKAGPLLRGLGLKARWQAVHGFSITVPVRHLDAHPHLGPTAGLLDTLHQVSISRLGQRMRVSGGLRQGEADGRVQDSDLAPLYAALEDWYPGAAALREVQRWQGGWTCAPDGLPLVGASGAPGVWLNIGHGAHGWSWASACARSLAEQIAGLGAAADMMPLSPQRFR